MLKNYFRIAFRNIVRHKAYSGINILGLSVGLACSFFIVLWVQDEVSTDRYHENGDRIYSVMRHVTLGGDIITTPSIPKPLDDVLVREYPEIIHSVLMSWGAEIVARHEDQAFRLDSRYAGTDLFKVFSYPLILGDVETILENPESIAISASTAMRYFGDEWRTRDDVLGSVIRVDDRLDAALTGVFEDLPANSTVQFDSVIPIQDFIARNSWVEGWSNNALRMYVMLREGASGSFVSAKISGLIDEHVDRWETTLFLNPINNAYLYSEFENGVLVGGRIEYVRIFILVAIFIILIASINFMNLATARSAQRAREIGVRKSVGATKGLLARQFLGESVFMACISFIVAMGLVALLLPMFNTLTEKAVELSVFDLSLWAKFGGIALITGLFAGSYPALYLSSINTIAVLRSANSPTSHGSGLRKALVVFQFVMSIVLIVGTFTVYKQLSYMRAKDLGVDRENVAYVDFVGGIEEQFDTFKEELLKEPGILSVASSSTSPIRINNDTISVEWDGKDPDDNTTFSNMSVGYGFLETLGMKLVEGRTFSRDFASDSTNYIINERTARLMGMDSPLGERLAQWGREGKVIGIAKDFNMKSLYEKIEPVIIRLDPDNSSVVFIRIAGGQTEEALAGLERVYEKFNPQYPFSYRFMDEDFEARYKSEIVIGSLANIFAFIAILIACLGLYGLASFTAEARAREIGIRKVLGATVGSVVLLLSRDFLVLVGGAFLIAAPLAYFLMDHWLAGFAFRTNIGPGVLAVAGIGSILIAWITVSYQSIRAASVNPATALKSD